LSANYCKPAADGFEATMAVISSSGSAPASTNAAAASVIFSLRAAPAAFSVNSSAPI
jgi:hypothetical protein